jgi:hypothetical protein
MNPTVGSVPARSMAAVNTDGVAMPQEPEMSASKTFAIHLGPGVSLDAATLVDTRMLVAGSSGSGKSYVMRLIAEQVAPKIQTIILDPEGEFTTLREAVDVVIVGTGGEVLPTVTTAAKLARKLLELQVSAVVDLYDLKLPDRRGFVKRFLESMMSVPKSLWRPCIVMLDEAHKMCPERSSGQAESTDAVITLLSQGRKRGFCGILSTQRLQKLHKDAAAETLNNLIGRTSLDTDVHRARDILGLAKADEPSLRQRPPGNWYGFGPAFVGIDGVGTFKANKATTTHPEPGKRHTLTPPAPSARIKKVLPELAELPHEVEQEANDLAAAQKKIGRLEAELRAARRTPEGRSDAEAASVRAALAQQQARAKDLEKARMTDRKLVESIRKSLVKIDESLSTAKVLVAHEFKNIEEVINSGTLPTFDAMTEQTVRERQAMRARLAKKDMSPEARCKTLAEAERMGVIDDRRRRELANGKTPGGKFRLMLEALVQHEKLSRKQLALVVCMASTGGTFLNYLGEGKKRGLWTEEHRQLQITDAGIAEAGEVAPLPSGEQLVEHWCAHPKLVGKSREMLRLVVDAGDDGISKEDLANSVDMTASGGTFLNYLGILRTLDLITRSEPFVAAAALRSP